MGTIDRFRRRRRRAPRHEATGAPLMWAALGIAAFTLFAAGSGLTGTTPGPDGSPEVSRFSGTVTRVVDGDTIHVSGHGRPVRLFGVDAPEMDTAAGGRARQRMVEIAARQQVTCRIRDRDRYGRSVAICTLPTGHDIGYTLITSGLATEYCRFSKDFYGTCG